jgi:hypothetical protein
MSEHLESWVQNVPSGAIALLAHTARLKIPSDGQGTLNISSNIFQQILSRFNQIFFFSARKYG